MKKSFAENFYIFLVLFEPGNIGCAIYFRDKGAPQNKAFSFISTVYAFKLNDIDQRNKNIERLHEHYIHF